MYRAEIERKDLIRFKEGSPINLSNNPELAENIDLMPIVRLLSLIGHEKEAVNQVA